MSIDYKPLPTTETFPDAPMMYHTDRRLERDTHCDYCEKPLEDRWIAVVTDRSGSECATIHEGCVKKVTVEDCFDIMYGDDESEE